MNKKKILIISTFILIIALVGVLPVSAEAVKTDYSSNATMCEILDMGTTWSGGGIMHYRNVKNKQFVYSADETRVIGFQYATLNWDYNTKTASGVIWGTFTHDVESGGTWRGTVIGKMNEYGLVSEGIGRGKGYGDLDGLLVKATFYEDDNVDPNGVPLEECTLGTFWPTQIHTEAVIIDTTNH